MVINYSTYKVFSYTEKMMKKRYSQEILDKYGKQLAMLFQNGYKVDATDMEDVEEQMWFFNNFSDTDDLVDLKALSYIPSDYEVGTKIITEELYKTLTKTAYCRQSAESMAVIKTLCKSNWKNIEEEVENIYDLFSCKDSEIDGVLRELPQKKAVMSSLEKIDEQIEKENIVKTWMLFCSLNQIIFSIYTSLGKKKTETKRSSIYTGFKDELYGLTGGYNVNSGEMKVGYGSAVYDLKTIYTTEDISKVKAMAKTIIKDNKQEEFDPATNPLGNWVKGGSLAIKDDEARRIVINCLLNGILTILSEKYDLNLLEDKRNSGKADSIRTEFENIMNYAGIPHEYLMEKQ